FPDSCPDLSLNPLRYLPAYSESVRAVMALGGRPGWRLERLGDIAKVFMGPRIARPLAEEGVTSGPGIIPFYVPGAMIQSKPDSIKYLDLNRASPSERQKIETTLIAKRGWIVITRSGTIGRVIYTQARHEGAAISDDLIRVVIDDEPLRGYVYQFLQSEFGQHQ